MVQMWFLDDACSDLRLPNKCLSTVDQITLDNLASIGVLYFKINEEELEEIRRNRAYNYADEVTINKDSMVNYEEKIKMFAEEHLHTDDEIRYVAEGSGYFDVRDQDDKWIRILVETGDLIILPAGIYHRFVADK
uniref:acireductone dioxygenase (Fe(2+)-requiring) n=1 Tax=Romanomermis culicivorax TaxID=13658 RepID=A0A915I571_ROMCU